MKQTIDLSKFAYHVARKKGTRQIAIITSAKNRIWRVLASYNDFMLADYAYQTMKRIMYEN